MLTGKSSSKFATFEILWKLCGRPRDLSCNRNILRQTGSTDGSESTRLSRATAATFTLVLSPFQLILGRMVTRWLTLCKVVRRVLQVFFSFNLALFSKMARQRKGKHSFDSSRDHVDRTKFPRRRVKESSFKPILVLAAVFGLPLFLFGAYKLWNYKLSTRLFTPLDAPLIINKSEMEMSRFWGTYRSNLYFGLR